MRLRSSIAFWSIVDKLIMGAAIGLIALAAWASLR
jgi:aspartate-semialdehyde dehydrogenase